MSGDDALPLLDVPILDDLEKRVGRARFIAVMQTYIDHSKTLLAALGALGPLPTHAEIYPIVHQLAGASGSLGIARLGQEALNAELGADETPDTRGARRDRILAVAAESAVQLHQRYAELSP